MIYGTPARSLERGTFGTPGRRAVGAAGEKMTAEVLDGFWEHAAVFHDLHIPGYLGNVDHAVLAGDQLLILDSKTWKAGRYWSIGASYFHGLDRTHTPTRNVANAQEAYSAYLNPYGVQVVKPLVVLWTRPQVYGHRLYRNSRGAVTGAWAKKEARPFLHYTYPGAKVIPGNDLYTRTHRFVRAARHTPNPAAVEAILHQLY